MSAVSPAATLQSLLIAICMSFLITGLRRLLVDQKKLAALRRELKEYEKLIKKAMRAKDEKTRAKVERKLKKRMAHFERVRRELSGIWIKSMISMFLSFFLLIFVLSPLFGREPVAYFPIGLEGPMPVPFVLWYGLCAMSLGMLIQRALGLGMTPGE
ncbi:MAG TPA: DUF106 domain-containing protein [Candidatus Bathyarchaeota archaeon]|nr:DUF106 domain-containing protein [Candidatus Bathyarchaeota archaeon]